MQVLNKHLEALHCPGMWGFTAVPIGSQTTELSFETTVSEHCV